MLSSIELICTASAVLPEALPNFTLQFGVELGYNLVDSDTCDNRCVAVLLYCISFDEIE